MKREQWLKWEPLSGITPTLYLKKLKYEQNILTLEAQDKPNTNTPIFTIYFNDFLTARTMFEEDKLSNSYDYDKTIVQRNKQNSPYCNWSLFRVEKSHYIEWFVQQNVGINQDISIVHYLIFTLHNLIEVLVPEDSIPTAIWN